MARVIANASMSLDGFVAAPTDPEFEHLFAWYEAGGVETPTANPGLTFHLSPDDAEVWQEMTAGVGALITGRRTFDQTGGWGGRHPVPGHVFVVTHTAPTDWAFPDAPFTFVTDGLPSAVAQARAAAGEGIVALTAGSLAGQALSEGLLDEVWVSLSPVVLGSGTPFWTDVVGAPHPLEIIDVRKGSGVTHLRYAVRR
jgi:dihydrofolate reductase